MARTKMLAFRPSTRPCLTRETGKPSLLSSSTSTCLTRQTVAVQKPRCRNNGASCCNNSADEQSLWRSTKSIHDRYDVPRPMPTCGAEQSSLPWNVIIYNFPGCSAAETAYKGAPAMDDYISPSGESGLADRASSQASKWAPRCSRCSAAAPKHVICLH